MQTDFKGLTPFHYAAQGGHIECIEILRRELPFVEAWTDDLGLNYTTWAFVRGYLSSDFCVHGVLIIIFLDSLLT